MDVTHQALSLDSMNTERVDTNKELRPCRLPPSTEACRPMRTHLHALLPADEEVPARQEAGDGVSGQVVDPALAAQLGHDGVNERVPGAALRPRLRPQRTDVTQ